MNNREEWQHSDYTVELVRWLEKKREDWTLGCLEQATLGHAANAGMWAGQVNAAKMLLAKIREKKGEE